jgi:hypothetical protein
MTDREKPLDEKKLLSMGSELQGLSTLIDATLSARAILDGFRPPGFALIAFAFDGDEAVHVSNCDRSDMIKALIEVADMLQAGEDETRAPGGARSN